MAFNSRAVAADYMRSYMLRRYHQRRTEAIARLGGVCVRCGATDDLEIDHKDPATKTGEISKLWSYAKTRFDTEIIKCQLLCRQCHIRKTIRDAGKKPAWNTHGTLSSYRYCKCDVCRAAKSAYYRSHRKT